MESLENFRKEIKPLKNRDFSKTELEKLINQHSQVIDLIEELNEISNIMYIELRSRYINKPLILTV